MVGRRNTYSFHFYCLLTLMFYYLNIGPNEVAVTSSSSSTTTQVSSTVNEVVPVNLHPANVSQKNTSCAETRVPLAVHNHNHNDIVNFVGSGNYHFALSF